MEAREAEMKEASKDPSVCPLSVALSVVALLHVLTFGCFRSFVRSGASNEEVEVPNSSSTGDLQVPTGLASLRRFQSRM
jgi:hypothetical protein